MNRSQLTAIIVLSVALVMTAAIAQLAGTGSGYDLSWHTIDGGGGTSVGGTYELSGTLGQHDAGAMAGGSFTLTGGFWAGASAGDVPTPVTCPGDLTGSEGSPDGVVDGLDLLFLLSCWGPVEPRSACVAADLTGSEGPDGVVDGLDLLFLLSAWGDCPR